MADELPIIGDKKLVDPDPFDPASLRISTDYAATVGVKRIRTTVPVRKPGRQDFVRVHPTADYSLDTLLIELKEDLETYLLTPGLHLEMFNEATPVRLVTTINRQGVVFLWPLKLPDDTGRSNRWHDSAMDAAERAKDSWIRLQADMSLGAYQLFEAQGNLSDPEWPEESFRDLLEIAFKGRYIDTFDHPVLKRLRGEV